MLVLSMITRETSDTIFPTLILPTGAPVSLYAFHLCVGGFPFLFWCPPPPDPPMSCYSRSYSLSFAAIPTSPVFLLLLFFMRVAPLSLSSSIGLKLLPRGPTDDPSLVL